MRVYLDLDGVLCDMMRHAAEWHQLEYPDVWPPGQYDLQVALGHRGTRSEFWKHLDGEEFWATVPWMADGQLMLDTVERLVGPSNITIMTSPTIDPGCAKGKVMWIQKHIPQYRRRFAVTPCKEEFASPDKALVDDSDEKIQKFQAYGGYGILVPRPWNGEHSRAHDAVRLVGLHLSVLMKGIKLQKGIGNVCKPLESSVA